MTLLAACSLSPLCVSVADWCGVRGSAVPTSRSWLQGTGHVAESRGDCAVMLHHGRSSVCLSLLCSKSPWSHPASSLALRLYVKVSADWVGGVTHLFWPWALQRAAGAAAVPLAAVLLCCLPLAAVLLAAVLLCCCAVLLCCLPQSQHAAAPMASRAAAVRFSQESPTSSAPANTWCHVHIASSSAVAEQHTQLQSEGHHQLN